MDKKALNDLHGYIRTYTLDMEYGSILLALIPSEVHFYVVLIDIHRGFVTIWDPDYMLSLCQHTPCFG